jgi:hypothetical protein
MRAGWDARLNSPSLAKLELQVLTVNETDRPLAARNSSHCIENVQLWEQDASTMRLTESMLDAVFMRARELLKEDPQTR